MKEYQYKEGYAKSLEGKRVEGGEDNEDNVEPLWEDVKGMPREGGESLPHSSVISLPI